MHIAVDIFFAFNCYFYIEEKGQNFASIRSWIYKFNWF